MTQPTPGFLALLLHAHLPFVRRPDAEPHLEESWLFEAITETYLPLVKLLAGWARDRLPVRLTITLSPTLCAMLSDRLLRERYERRLTSLIELAGKEVFRTQWTPAFQPLALFYDDRLRSAQRTWQACGGDLVGAFARAQDSGQIEIIPTAATHALLPLLGSHLPSLRAQMFVARDAYRECFERSPRGFWLPECGYAPEVAPVLRKAGLDWVVTDAHGVLHAQPPPARGVFAPVRSPAGLAVFGRDPASAEQVWSRDVGYPGDPRYRDFYRDIGFDLDLDYLRPYLPAPDTRGFTGLKYHAIRQGPAGHEPYDRAAALAAASEHANHFLAARVAQGRQAAAALDRPPIMVAPYDAELFGHWWYEGPEFLDALVRRCAADPAAPALVTPSDYLARFPDNPTAEPVPSSWGEGGWWGVWLNEKTAWLLPHLRVAQERMTELARRFPAADGLTARALRQAARELLLAQASDWPFILHTGTSPGYARQRLEQHLGDFAALYDQICDGQVSEAGLAQLEARDNLFGNLDYRYWA